MSEYKSIKGFTIQEVTSDPPAPIDGQVWYNTTSGDLKARIVDPGSWSSAPDTGFTAANLWAAVGSAGTSTSFIAVHNDGPPSAIDRRAMTYDGTSFTQTPETTVPASARGCGVVGTATAALTIGGFNPSFPNQVTDVVASWNNTSWTNLPATIGTARYGAGALGTQTDAVYCGGDDRVVSPEATDAQATELYTGTNWTSGNNQNTPRYQNQGGATGTSTAGLYAAGRNKADPTTYLSATEEYNGTNWTSVNSANVAARAIKLSGTQTAAIKSGGANPYDGSGPYLASTELYNGTSWTTVGNLLQNRGSHVGGGVGSTSAIVTGGRPSGSLTSPSVETFAAFTGTRTFPSS